MTVVAELLLITDKIRSLILSKADASKIKKAAIEEGMTSLSMDSLQKIFLGITSVEEVLRAIISEADEEN
jgi:general secretion pathway protein E